jgi:hypothetical protein
MQKKTYQVWHDIGWPQSRINQIAGGWPPSRFPQDYIHIADVQANVLREVVQMTTAQGEFLQEIPWDRNRGVECLGHPRIMQRDTDQGDVIVDPQGHAYRVEQNGFSEILRANEQGSYSQRFAQNAAVRLAQEKEKDRGIEH